MATQEKLLKSLQTLKHLYDVDQPQDLAKKKEKVQNCQLAAEAILNPTIKIAKNFNSLLSFTIDVLLRLCDDNDSDVRMTADECLNRIIKGMMNDSVSKIQIELHKEIKKNGSAKSLRTALWKFALLAHFIRPQKGKAYVTILVPIFVKILERKEELIHETMAESLPKILASLGCFTMDNDIKSLLKACLSNLQDPSAVIRRTTSNCILTICLNSRKPNVFFIYVIKNLIDFLVPLQDSITNYLPLGVFSCMKTILPHIEENNDVKMQSNVGSKRDVLENIIASEKLLQVYELCLHYAIHTNHNVANIALETLNVLLQSNFKEFRELLVNPSGIPKNRITIFETTYRGRSPSQLSLATTLISDETLLLDSDMTDSIKSDIEKWIDESQLTVINVNYVKDAQESVANSENVMDKFDYSNLSIGIIDEQYTDSVKSESIVDRVDKLILSENSSEKSFDQLKSEEAVDNVDIECDIGSYTDTQVPLIYCARLISKRFLITGCKGGLIPDKQVRVSTKNLALSCLSSMLQIYPEILLTYLDKTCSNQQISDILIFEKHCDPQLRGATRMLIGNFIKGVLKKCHGNFDQWISSNTEVLKLGRLLHSILEGLKDDSSICSRQTLTGLETFLKTLLRSEDCLFAERILNYLPQLSKDPYRLVKVKLLEILTDLDFVSIEHAFESAIFQNRVISHVILEMLGDEDQRTRSAAVNSTVRILPSLYFADRHSFETTVTYEARRQKLQYFLTLMNGGDSDANINKKHFFETTPFPYSSCSQQPNDILEYSLSKFLSLLFRRLLISTSKYFIYGSFEVLSALSMAYPTTVYKMAWSCFKSVNVANVSGSLDCSSDLLNVTVSLMTNSIHSYELSCHINFIKLAGNLFAGKWMQNMKNLTEINAESQRELWDLLSDQSLAEISERFLIHIVKILNIFSHLIEDAVPAQSPAKPSLPNLPAASNLSPIKRRKSDLGLDKKILSPGKNGDKDDKKTETKVNGMGYFANMPHYMKFYEILKVAHNNYKITLDSHASENFLNFLNAVLSTLAQILEVASLIETGRIAEELLQYLKATFQLDSKMTVFCVQQLLKSLFGTNTSADIDEISDYLENFKSKEVNSNGFYNNLVQVPYNDISSFINSLNTTSKIDRNSDKIVMGYLHRKENMKTLAKGSDKISNFIRKFEPMVIKSLRHYTITSDVKLQCNILQLLSQLIQVRVNYCLLDSDQIIIAFVLGQFEYIEEGQIRYPEHLIPKIFNFLVHLSYGKVHSKNIIVIPKIIQLCDGLMASGQSPLTHCIPALKPLVEDVFLLRNKINTPDFEQLETTREVLVSMLLRLLEYKEVVDLISLVLNECKCCDNTDRWSRWSKQVFDVTLTLLRHNKLRFESAGCFLAAKRLVQILHSSAFKDVKEIIAVLFDEVPEQDEILLSRHLGKVTLLLLVLSQLNEEKLLRKIMENQSVIAPQSVFLNVKLLADPLNVTKTLDVFENVTAEEIFARFLFLTIYKVANSYQDNEIDTFFVEKLSTFLKYCIYILQSGSHIKTTNAILNLVNDDVKLEERLPLDDINKKFLAFKNVWPLLTLQWCQILTLLNYNNRSFWAKAMQLTESYGINKQLNENTLQQKRQCINLEIVRIGSSTVFPDYLSENISESEQMSWFLVNNIDTIVSYQHEPPITELLDTIHRNSSVSGVIVQAIATKCYQNSDPTYSTKILKCLENVHVMQTGSLVQFLIRKMLDSKQMAISRQVSQLASRKIELLLTLEADEVVKQIPNAELVALVDFLVSSKLVKRHETLVSLLNKLSTRFYDMSPLELDQRRSINADYIKDHRINSGWYLAQLKNRSHKYSQSMQLAEMLSHLTKGDLLVLFNDKDFNKTILYDCIEWIEHTDQAASELLEACSVALFKDVGNLIGFIPKLHQVFKPEGREWSPPETVYANRLIELLDEATFLAYLHETVPTVTQYVKSLSKIPQAKIPDSHAKDFVRLAVLCLEACASASVAKKSRIGFVSSSLECAEAVFADVKLCAILSADSNITWLCSSINSLFRLVNLSISESAPLPKLQQSERLDVKTAAGQAVVQMSILVRWLEKCQVIDMPKFLLLSIKNLVISLGRLPLVSSYVLIAPTAWKSGFLTTISGTHSTQVQPLSADYMQDIEILEELIYRITFFGWTTRQQFEESWVGLLGALGASTSVDSAEDANSAAHPTSLAVRGITSLLLQTLSVVGKMMHVPRDAKIDCTTESIRKLSIVHTNMHRKMKYLLRTEGLQNVFQKCNLEKLNNSYSYGQLSVEYLSIASKIVDVDGAADNEGFKKFRAWENVMIELGLDLNSCLQFLLDLYSQWINSEQSISLRLLQEMVKSILCISDLFSDKSQYQWMLDVCLDLSKNHASEDEMVHQYLLVCICKAVAVLTPGLEMYEVTKKIVVNGLKSAFLTTRIAAIHGLLYVLQACVMGNTVIGGVSEDMQLFLPTAMEYVLCHISSSNSILNQEHSLLLWSLSFYVIENVDAASLELDFIDTVLAAVLQILEKSGDNHQVYIPLLKGVERLLITRKLSKKLCGKVMKLAVEKLKSKNPMVALPAVQVLYSCIYTEFSEQFDQENEGDSADGNTVQTNPDIMVQIIEKISAIFDRIKKSYPIEAEILCDSLSIVLKDFFSPADILTKVISEFLSPQQRHPTQLSKIVFQVFDNAIEKSQLALLQDWVVCSLANFTQSLLPVGVATWYLTCFFIAASTNPHLRRTFALVQQRIGRYEYEDRKILCLAALDFYGNLSDSQKKLFVETLRKVKDQVDMPFYELLACL